MKHFNKVLAMFLALLTVIVMLPVSAIAASNPWLDIDGQKTGPESSKLTVTVDPDAAIALIESAGLNSSAVKTFLAGIRYDRAELENIISLDELFEIVPKEALLEIVDINEIISTIGTDKLLSFVDLNALIADLDLGTLITDADMEALVADVDLAALLDGVDLSSLASLIPNDKISQIADLGKLAKFVDADIVFDHMNIAGLDTSWLSDDCFDMNGIIDNLVNPEDYYSLLDFTKFSINTAGFATEDFNTANLSADGITSDNTAAILANPDRYLSASGMTKIKAQVSAQDIVDQVGLDKVIEIETLDALMDYVKVDVLASNGVITKMIDGGCLDTSAMLADPAFNFGTILSKINADPATDVKDVINFSKVVEVVSVSSLIDLIGTDKIMAQIDTDKVIAQIGTDKIIAQIGTDKIMAQIDTDELTQLIGMIDVKKYIQPIITLAYDRILANIDLLSLNGTVIAKEDDAGLLAIDAKAFIKAVYDAIPTLTELSETTGTILSMDLGLTYTVNGTTTQKNKYVTVEFVLASRVDLVRKAAAKAKSLMDRYISYNIDPSGSIKLDVEVPAIFAQYFNRFLNTAKLSDALKLKVMTLADLDGNAAVAFAQDLTVEEIVEILDQIDTEKLYNAALNVSYVQKCLSIVKEKTGRDFSGIAYNDLVDFAVKAAEKALGTAEKVPGYDKIAEFFASKTGYSFEEILDKLDDYNTEELIDTVLQKAKESVNAFNTVKGYAMRVIDRIPDQLMDLSLMDGYNGNGNFSIKKSVTVNPGVIAEKIFDKFYDRVMNKIGSSLPINIDKSKVQYLINRIPQKEYTISADISVTVDNVYAINYMKGDYVMKRCFMPVGANIDLFKYNQENAGVDFEGWYDADDNLVSTMPASDITVYVKGAGPTGPVDVTIYDQNGNLIKTVTVNSGESLDAATIAEINGQITVDKTGLNQYLFDTYTVEWHTYDLSTTTAGASVLTLATEIFTADTAIIAVIAPDYFNFVEGVGDYDVNLTETDGAYLFDVVTKGAITDSFSITLDREHMLKMAKDGMDVTLKLTFAGETKPFLTVDSTELAALYDKSTAAVKMDFNTLASAPTSLQTSVYASNTTAKFYSFDLLLDGNANHDKFDGKLTLCLPFTDAIAYSASSADFATRIHVADETGKIESIPRANSDETGYVTFDAPHFSDFVVDNEYLVELISISEDPNDTTFTATLDGIDSGDMYLPAGATFNVKPIVGTGYTWVKTEYAYGSSTGTITFGGSFTMPANKLTLTVTAKPRVFHIFYYVNGVQKYDQTYYASSASTVALEHLDETDVKNAAPANHKSTYSWVGFESSLVGVSDMYVFAAWDAITYTANFMANGALVQAITFTADNYQDVVAPAIPGISASKTGTWGTYDLTAAFSATDYTVTINAIFNDVNFTVSNDGNVTVAATAKAGETVTVTPKTLEGYEGKINVVTASGTVVTVTDNKFTMPAENVSVSVEYTALPLTYKVGNDAPATGAYGENITVTVTLNAGEILKSYSNFLSLADVTRSADGKVTFTFVFTLLTDNTVVEIVTDTSALAAIKIVNGKQYTDAADPTTDVKGVTFKGWSDKVAGAFSFAIFEKEQKEESLLWLWILLIVLAIILLIILFYNLYINGVLKPNFFLYFIAWIVSIYFAVCLAIAAFVLWIAGFFGYKEENKDEDKKEDKEEVKEDKKDNE